MYVFQNTTQPLKAIFSYSIKELGKMLFVKRMSYRTVICYMIPIFKRNIYSIYIYTHKYTCTYIFNKKCRIYTKTLSNCIQIIGLYSFVFFVIFHTFQILYSKHTVFIDSKKVLKIQIIKHVGQYNLTERKQSILSLYEKTFYINCHTYFKKLCFTVTIRELQILRVEET